MLFLQKSTPCGRFTVSITSNDVSESSILLRQESARSLKALSDLLTEAASCSLEAAVWILEAHGVDGGALGDAQRSEHTGKS